MANVRAQAMQDMAANQAAEQAARNAFNMNLILQFQQDRDAMLNDLQDLHRDLQAQIYQNDANINNILAQLHMQRHAHAINLQAQMDRHHNLLLNRGRRDVFDQARQQANQQVNQHFNIQQHANAGAGIFPIQRDAYYQ